MSRSRMRETFGSVIVKRIYTLEFDRATIIKPSVRRSLENAVTGRGVVIATPTTIKSIMLSYIEVLQQLKDAHSLGLRSKINDLRTQAEELNRILGLFKEGIMLLDEVDMILHPLKSELNFPIGEKQELDCSTDGERWSLPIHLFDMLFYAQTDKMSSLYSHSSVSKICERFKDALQAGIANRDVQRLPHGIFLCLL